MVKESTVMIHFQEIKTAVESRMSKYLHPAEVSAEPRGEDPASEPVAWKQQVLSDFAHWLDALPDAQPPPEMDGDATDASGDLLALIGETTALRQEVKLMGRNTGKLLGSVEQVAENVTANVLPLAEERRRQDREVRQTEARNLLRPLLLEMGDLQDAIREADGQIADPCWPWYVPARIRRLAGVERYRGIHGMLIRRIDSILQRHDVKPVATVRERFDAAVMTAAGVSRDGAVDPGHVRAIVKQGFAVSGDLLRPAHVIVEEGTVKSSMKSMKTGSRSTRTATRTANE